MRVVHGNVILKVLDTYPASESLVGLLPRCNEQLPEGVRFEDDVWDILTWQARKGNARFLSLDFRDFSNKELKELTKIFILHRRLTGKIGEGAAMQYVSSIKLLDKMLWRKPAKELVNADFYRTEKYMEQNYESAPRLAFSLGTFGKWLNAKVGLPISYTSGIPPVYKHGRKGTEEGRQTKLINTLVIRDMIEANARKDLSNKDHFYLSVFTIFVATGFRIGELATLPKKCLEEMDGTYGIHYIAEKVRRLEVRPFPADMLDAVQTAINHILEITEPGREAVKALKENPGYDWIGILDDKAATEYFIQKFCHEWTSNPRNLMINPDGVWVEKEKRIIDIIAEIERAGSKSAASRTLNISRTSLDGLLAAQLNARKGLLPCTIASRGKDIRTDWDTDARVLSYLKFIDHCKIFMHMEDREWWRGYIDEAKQMQLEGKIYPAPPINPDFEQRFKRKIHPVVQDRDGNSLLEPEDALLIIPRYAFSEARGTKNEDYRLISEGNISRWFSGELRSHGTGNHEDSCFNRLGIIDPETEEIVKFTSHDIRHWLDTTYAEGHMPEEIISLIFSRKPGSNHVYDQTSKKKRLENIRQAIRDGKSLGDVAENYNRLAMFSRDEAEQYLLAGTRMVNIMPHGNCSLSWGMEACPNHLSCFAGCGESGCCEHFSIDVTDEEQVREVKRIEREAEETMQYMGGEGIQFEHFSKIKRNIGLLLERG